jgi:hypothetical protein
VTFPDEYTLRSAESAASNESVTRIASPSYSVPATAGVSEMDDGAPSMYQVQSSSVTTEVDVAAGSALALLKDVLNENNNPDTAMRVIPASFLL